MPRLMRRAAAIRAAKRWFHRFLHVSWRVVRVVVMAGAAMGPAPPPPPPPKPPPIEARAHDGDASGEERTR